MMRRKYNVLIVSSDINIFQDMSAKLLELGQNPIHAPTFEDAFSLIQSNIIDLVFSQVQVRGVNGLKALSYWLSFTSTRPIWYFFSKNSYSPSQTEVVLAGAFGHLKEPLALDELNVVLENTAWISRSPISRIPIIIQSISGVRLAESKRSMIESRLIRRVNQVGFSSSMDYLKYFDQNRATEIPELISLLTTHTTSFFRESAHFDYLNEVAFPYLFKNKTLRIWSAACSTGEEVFSLAIAALEFKKKRLPHRPLEIEVVGTDIDQNSIGFCKNGIYNSRHMSGLTPMLQKQYFEHLNSEGMDYYKVSDEAFDLCQFHVHNLFEADSFSDKFDIIFLRNVLIYFSPSDVEIVLVKLYEKLNPDGCLVLGHSEGIDEKNENFKLDRNSIYRVKSQFSSLKNWQEPKIEVLPRAIEFNAPPPGISPLLPKLIQKQNSGNVHDLILIAASTGGVQALKTIFKDLPASTPPIIIVQHIPAKFSQSLAKSLSDCSHIKVTEAVDGELVEPSRAYLAPGGQHLMIKRMGTHLAICLSDNSPASGPKPSADILFQSVFNLGKKVRVVAAVLTGMGDDGAKGLKALSDLGHRTIIQSEASCVVYGMPKAARQLNENVEVVSLEDLAGQMLLTFAQVHEDEGKAV